jgi:hypothetical protein
VDLILGKAIRCSPMTEQEWLHCAEPDVMLTYLLSRAREWPERILFWWRSPSERKWRLFACACCRRIWPCFEDERSRKAVEVSEKYADGLARRGELSKARKAAERAAMHDASWWEVFRDWLAMDIWGAAGWDPQEAAPFWVAARRVSNVVKEDIAGPVLAGGSEKRQWPDGVGENAFARALREDRLYQCALLRDIFGNPFRGAPFVNPICLTPPIKELAELGYEHRLLPEGTLNRERLAALADGLEAAGCDDAEILEHLRGVGPHVRGCWVVDAVLGKG